MYFEFGHHLLGNRIGRPVLLRFSDQWFGVGEHLVNGDLEKNVVSLLVRLTDVTHPSIVILLLDVVDAFASQDFEIVQDLVER